MGGTEFSGLKLTPSCCSVLCSLLENRASLKLGATPKELAALTSRPSLNIEPTSSQISEETLESLKLREKNFECQTTPEPTKQQQKDIPTSDITQRRGDSVKPRHFNLKASTKQNLYSAGTGRIISKVRIIIVLLLMIDTGKIVWK